MSMITEFHAAGAPNTHTHYLCGENTIFVPNRDPKHTHSLPLWGKLAQTPDDIGATVQDIGLGTRVNAQRPSR